MNPLLSLCIPTYNRRDLLLMTLDNLLPQLKQHEIPVYIRDNASPDDTVAMLERYKAEKYSNLFFKRNPENLGFDRNLRLVVEDASTEYCWLLGDDDWADDGAVAAIMSALSSHVGLVLVNSAAYKHDMQTVVNPDRLGFAEDRLYEADDHSRLLSDTAQSASSVSCMVIDRLAWLRAAGVNYPKNYSHVGATFVSVLGKRAHVIGKPLIKLRVGCSPQAPALKYEVLMVNWPAAIWGLPADYADDAKRSITMRDRRSSLCCTVAARALGMYNNDIYWEYIAADRGIKKTKKWLLRLVAWVPKPLCQAGSIAYLCAVRPKGYQVLISDILHTS